MSDLPISFSGPMVRAILREIEQPGTGKTQTRRVLMKTRNGTPVEMHPSGDANRHPFNDPDQWGFPYYDRSTDSTEIMRLSDYARRRYALGDRLYVREHWRGEAVYDDTPPRDIPFDACMVRYEADGAWSDHDAMTHAGRFRQAMHMPKWASRITLIVTDVRVERLQDCSEADALAEGVVYDEKKGFIVPGVDHPNPDFPYLSRSTAREMYAALWDVINGSSAWAANPWVVAYTFKPILGNIDQIGCAL